MEPNVNELEMKVHRKCNGQSVMSALNFFGDVATSEKICNHIANEINQPVELVKPEVQAVLRRGVSNGFLVRIGKNYQLPELKVSDETDSQSRNKRDKSSKIDVRYQPYKVRTQRKNNEVNQEPGTSKDAQKEIELETESSTIVESTGDDDTLSIRRDLTLNIEQTDGKSNCVILNPRLAVNAILEELNKELASKQQENSPIDLGAIILKNLNSASIEHN